MNIKSYYNDLQEKAKRAKNLNTLTYLEKSGKSFLNTIKTPHTKLSIQKSAHKEYMKLLKSINKRGKILKKEASRVLSDKG